MPDAVDSSLPAATGSEELAAIQQALAQQPLGKEVMALEQWFDALGATDRAAVLYALLGRCHQQEIEFAQLARDVTFEDVDVSPGAPTARAESASPRADHFEVFDRLTAVNARRPVRLQNSPLRYIGKQDHFSQAFLRPQTFNPWPISQEIGRPKSAADSWSWSSQPPIRPPEPSAVGRNSSAPSTPAPANSEIQSPWKRHAKPTPTTPSGHSSPVPSNAHASHGGQGAGLTPGHPSHSGPGNGYQKRNVNFMDPELLADIGAWLRSLRLHKYTDNLSGMPWQEVVRLSDAELEQRGVNALGARRKMLKMFEEIRAAQEAGRLPK